MYMGVKGSPLANGLIADKCSELHLARLSDVRDADREREETSEQQSWELVPLDVCDE